MVSTTVFTFVASGLWGQVQGGGESRFIVAVVAAFVVPALLAVTTAFARILIVLFFLRAGLGSNVLPPNTVIIGIAVLLTWLVMGPTIRAVAHNAIEPLYRGEIEAPEALVRCERALRGFMAAHVDGEDFRIIARAVGCGGQPARAPFEVLATAFALSELRVAFIAGLLIYLPFLAVDVVVYLVMAAVGPGPFSAQMIALPIKVAFFVMADGWRLIFGAILGGYGG